MQIAILVNDGTTVAAEPLTAALAANGNRLASADLTYAEPPRTSRAVCRVRPCFEISVQSIRSAV